MLEETTGPGILWFVRHNRWRGGSWHYLVDGRETVVREASTADPTDPVLVSIATDKMKAAGKAADLIAEATGGQGPRTRWATAASSRRCARSRGRSKSRSTAAAPSLPTKTSNHSCRSAKSIRPDRGAPRYRQGAPRHRPGAACDIGVGVVVFRQSSGSPVACRAFCYSSRCA